MKFRQIMLNAALMAPVCCIAQTSYTQQCVSITKNDVIHFFDHWNEALQNKNLDVIVSSYDKNAVLFPTLSNKPHANHDEIRNYFVDFIKRSPSAAITQRTIKTGCNWATDTGLYTFELKSPTTTEIKARYSLIYEYLDGHWLIIHHHSSMVPTVKDANESPDPNF